MQVEAPWHNHHQPSSNNSNHHQPSSDNSNHHQPSSNNSNHHQPSSNNSNHHQPSSNNSNHHRPSSNNSNHHQPSSNNSNHHRPSSNNSNNHQPSTDNTTTTNQAPTTATTNMPYPDTTSTPSGQIQRVCKKEVLKKKCPICQVQMHKTNLKRHIERKHTAKQKDITATSHLLNECIDQENGIYCVHKSFHGASIPLHVQNKIWGENQHVSCESTECQVNMELAWRSGLKAYQCTHIKSIAYCSSYASSPLLSDITLTEMVNSKWFGEDKKKVCLDRQNLAKSNHVPLSVHCKTGTPKSVKYISVYEPTISYFSRLGRVMVSYDTKKNSWHCPCQKTRRSCIHKYIAKWHLFQTNPELFSKVRSTEELEFLTSAGDDNRWSEADHEGDRLYPPKDKDKLKVMIQYILMKKKLPPVLPEEIRLPSVEKEYPRHLIPEEMMCQHCPGNVPLGDPILITQKAKILTSSRIVQGRSVIYPYCCQQSGGIFGKNYRDNPPVVIMDLHKKGAFHLSVSDLALPPEDFQGEVDMHSFWEALSVERIGRGFVTKCKKVRPPKPAEVSEITVTEDRLREELYRQKFPISGGWAVILCPCGIVYSIKCNIRAESPRDFADMLLSWKHMPNVVIYDFARGLATHMNLREPESLPFKPFEGRLRAPTPDNIAKAKDGKLKVSLPWLNCKKNIPDTEGHPITGSAEHYALYDRFHEDNTKDPRDVLRKLDLVPQLAGKVNSQVAEQLFSRMKKNNYFLNMALPSTHLFLMRNIIHHHNMHRNEQRLGNIKRAFENDVTMNRHSQAVLGNYFIYLFIFMY
nr:uncharacterized protein LOC110437946 [Danio rerio]|eukprot:XP_021322232.1 uncharacterized protein LOC110437946 [Danio rerio]